MILPILVSEDGGRPVAIHLDVIRIATSGSSSGHEQHVPKQMIGSGPAEH